MGQKTGISWCDHTWSPWIGCQDVSDACRFCYAKALDHRFGRDSAWGPRGTRRVQSNAYWGKLFALDRSAWRAGKVRSVFPSMCDPFDNHHSIPPEWRARHWAAIRQTPHLLHLLLTKRPENILRYLPPDWGARGYNNVWLGATAEDQPNLAHRAWHLAQAPAALRFISYEPALGAITPARVTNRLGTTWNAITGRVLDARSGPPSVGAISWWICGDESGPHRRPTDRAWTRSLYDQCAAAGVAFFNKQAVENGELTHEPMLDGVLHRAFPKPRAAEVV